MTNKKESCAHKKHNRLDKKAEHGIFNRVAFEIAELGGSLSDRKDYLHLLFQHALNLNVIEPPIEIVRAKRNEPTEEDEEDTKPSGVEPKKNFGDMLRNCIKVLWDLSEMTLGEFYEKLGIKDAEKKRSAVDKELTWPHSGKNANAIFDLWQLITITAYLTKLTQEDNPNVIVGAMLSSSCKKTTIKKEENQSCVRLTCALCETQITPCINTIFKVELNGKWKKISFCNPCTEYYDMFREAFNLSKRDDSIMIKTSRYIKSKLAGNIPLDKLNWKFWSNPKLAQLHDLHLWGLDDLNKLSSDKVLTNIFSLSETVLNGKRKRIQEEDDDELLSPPFKVAKVAEEDEEEEEDDDDDDDIPPPPPLIPPPAIKQEYCFDEEEDDDEDIPPPPPPPPILDIPIYKKKTKRRLTFDDDD